MLNLVINACDAMAGGRARAAPADRAHPRGRRADGAVQISFTDCGPGFTPEQYDKLFEPFYTTKPHGLGLGLSISRAIIARPPRPAVGQLHPRQGASFHMVLPALAGKGR